MESLPSDKRAILNLSFKGDSHDVSGKPCQDYSLSWTSDDGLCQAIIVSDGHGSQTYVRSDRGSKLASEIALSCIKRFIAKTNPRIFIGSKGAVTSREPDLSLRTRFTPGSSDERIRQREQFAGQIVKIERQDEVLQPLFNEIYKLWHEAILKDANDFPLDDYEKACLGNNEMVKAYGATLMAYFQTPYYWVAFHIGDGRLIAADRHLTWSQLVPWDYQCFLNYTTSLCGFEPVCNFRYAFSGCGDFPSAVICCSDGIEDSYGDYTLAPEYLHNFYTGLMRELHTKGFDYVREKLVEFLPLLSKKGSQDDMSIAMLVNLGHLDTALRQKKIEERRDQINDEHNQREKAINALSIQLADLRLTIEKTAEMLSSEQIQYKSLLQRAAEFIANLRKERKDKNALIDKLTDEILKIKEKAQGIQELINLKIEENHVADAAAREQKEVLRQQYTLISQEIKEQESRETQTWRLHIADIDDSAYVSEPVMPKVVDDKPESEEINVDNQHCHLPPDAVEEPVANPLPEDIKKPATDISTSNAEHQD